MTMTRLEQNGRQERMIPDRERPGFLIQEMIIEHAVRI
jgi:hypothetical protein